MKNPPGPASDGPIGQPRSPAADLLPQVYDELRRLAAARLSALPPGQTLQPTALVHEAYMRLVGSHDPGWDGRGHFFGAAANAMRNVMVDAARRKSRDRHGAGRDREPLTLVEVPGEQGTIDVLQLDRALSKLEQIDRVKAEVVTLRFFAGLSVDEAARAMGLSAATIDRHWAYARAWLRREMERSETGGDG